MSSTAIIASPERDEEDVLGITYDVVEGERMERDRGMFELSVSNFLFSAMLPAKEISSEGRLYHEMYFRMRRDHPVCRPDLAFISFAKWPARRSIPRRGDAWQIVADLAIEVISPNDKMSEAMPKLRRYFEASVRSVWHVMPFIESVYVYDSPKKITVFDIGDELECPALFPGWKLPVATLFPPETEE